MHSTPALPRRVRILADTFLALGIPRIVSGLQSLSSRCLFPLTLDKGLCGDTKPFMQSPNHLESQRPPPVEHLMDTITAPDERNKVARLKSVLIHMGI